MSIKKHTLFMKRLTIFILLTFALCGGAFAQTLSMDKSTKLYGYKNSDGAWQIAPQFQYAYPFEGKFKRFAVVKQDHHWGCIDVRGEMMIRNVFHSAEEAEVAGKKWEEGGEPGKWVYPAQNPADGKWGFVDYYGKWKFSAEYEDVRAFVGTEPMAYATVRTDGRWGCIDSKGVMVIEPIFMEQNDAHQAGEQWINGRHYDTWRYPTKDKQTGLWGYVNYLGRWVVMPQYEDRDFFGPDHNYIYAQVKKDGRWGSIDRNGKVVSITIFPTMEIADYALMQLEHGRKIDGWRYPVTDIETEKWGWVDYTGEWVIEPIYDGASHFINDTGEYATAKLEGFWCSIAANGEWLSRNVFTLSREAARAGYEWDNGQELGHWLYPIRDKETNYWGWVDYKGQWVINPTFEDGKEFIYSWNNRTAPAKMDNKWGCIDHTGQFVIKNIYNSSSEASIAGRKWSEKNKF